jgi:glycerophosphoryl diester phosphodiesterase
MTTIYAHRGCTLDAVENTLEAMAAAVALGCDGVELDVHRTLDGVIVVHHDATLSDGRAIAQLNVAELPDSVPTLLHVLEVLGDLECNVELKSDEHDPAYDPTDGFAAAVIAVVGEAHATRRVIYSSFDRTTCEHLVALDHDAKVGWLVPVGTELEAVIDEARAAGFSAIHPFVWSVTEAGLRRAHEAGLAINTWTVNGEDDLNAMVALGVDCIITDRPDLGLIAVAGSLN